jgi:CO/xanthine dehydrogenase FAD-binding subunit
MTSLAASLDGVATLHAPDGGIREVPVKDFVTGDGSNLLRPGELLRQVLIPAASLQARIAFRQVSLSPVGRSAVLVIACRQTGQTIVTITAATSRPVQLRFPAMPAPAEALIALDRARPGYLDDVHGSRPWREAMSRRAVAEVITELTR